MLTWKFWKRLEIWLGQNILRVILQQPFMTWHLEHSERSISVEYHMLRLIYFLYLHHLFHSFPWKTSVNWFSIYLSFWKIWGWVVRLICFIKFRYVEEHIQKTGVAIETQGFTIVTSGKKRESLLVIFVDFIEN